MLSETDLLFRGIDCYVIFYDFLDGRLVFHMTVHYTSEMSCFPMCR